MSTYTILRRPQDIPQDVKSARTQALSFVQDIQLDSLDDLLKKQQAEHATVQQELSTSNEALETLIRQARDTLITLQHRARAAKDSLTSLESDVTDFHDEIYSPISHHSGPSSSATGVHSRSSTVNNATLFETLQSIHFRIQSLTRVRDLFERLAKVEELALIAKEQVKLPRPDDSIETYRELVDKVREICTVGDGDTSHGHSSRLSSANFVIELARITQRDLGKALEAKLVSTLDALNWPAKKLQPDELDYSNNAKAKAFKAAFLDLCKLEQTFQEYSLPDQNLINSSSGHKEQCALAISALAQPLILRFRYHFDGKRQTNRLDKPEWYFANVLNALHDHEAFIRYEIQNMFSRSDLKQIDAMTDFITALIRPLNKKIRASMPQLLEMPAILAHTLYQALHFDQSVRDAYSYNPRLENGKKEEWKGTADVILGNKAWFDGWRESERKFTEDKFFEIISAAEAWHINEDYSPPTANGIKPTNSALKVRDLFEQVTDRYRPLPAFEHRLPFFIDIQIPLLEGYLSRISSATDAFETLSFGLMRAVPGTLAGAEGSSIRLTNGLNGLQRLVRALASAAWMETVIKEWSEDMFFLDLWQDIRETATKDASVRQKCKTLLEYTPDGNTAKYGEIGLFDSYISAFHNLSERISDVIVKHVVREVNNELKAYLGKRWDEPSFPAPLAVADEEPSSTLSTWPNEISTELISPVTVFSALLSSLSNSLPPLPLNKLYRQFTSQIQDILLNRSVFPKIWSERGGCQFNFDVEKGWLSAAKDASKGKIKKPENGLRKLLDAGLLVSLPASNSVRSLNNGETVTITKVVQVAWDDTNDAAFNEILMKLGVRELNGRKEVKNILKRRPECWR